ncbi:hypothetical protein [Haemophilus haemolyticus]|uniref:hypothetical protein n=1 Tax=Haemophilus haemolyticus TaxID=726 RepID=UPI001864B85A|nr:hypothetical protein [Haemophilus haemolyticus]
MKKRKIIQIAVSESMAYDQISEEVDCSSRLIALCDDGTLWVKKVNGWVELDEIPQDN